MSFYPLKTLFNFKKILYFKINQIIKLKTFKKVEKYINI